MPTRPSEVAAGERRAVMAGAVRAALARPVELADMEGPAGRVVLGGTTGEAGPEAATQAMGGARVVQVEITGVAIMGGARVETAIQAAKGKMEEAWVILKGGPEV